MHRAARANDGKPSARSFFPMNLSQRVLLLSSSLAIAASSGGGTGEARPMNAGTDAPTRLDAGPMDMGPPNTGSPMATCTTPTPPDSTDQQILNLPLFMTAAIGTVDNTAESSGWMSQI